MISAFRAARRATRRIIAACALLAAVAPPVAGQSGQRPQVDPPADPGEVKLVLTPTARTLPQGEVSLMLLGPLPIVQVGLTDWLSAGVGLFVFDAGDGRAPLLITPKWQVAHRGHTRVTVGALHLAGIADASVGLAYVVATRGESDSAVTAGVGWLYARDEGNGGAAPAAIVGAERRISPRIKLVADSYVFDGGAWTSFAVRFVRRHLATDVGITVYPFDSGLAAFPSLTLVWRF